MRTLHPVAWWVWAAALATAGIRTTNPIVLLLIVAVAAYVVAARRSSAAWAASFSTFLKLGVAVLAFRVAVQVVFGFRVPGYVLLDLPALRLPEWAAGVVVGGPVTLESLALALYEGLRLLAVLACFGAANALSSPYRLLRSLPNVLYEAGVVVTVALSFAPQLVITAKRIRAARRLRGRPTSGVAGLRGFLVPVLEGALERSLHLAASMDARGFGRRPDVPAGAGARSGVATSFGILAIAGGLYGLLDTTAPPVLGLPLLAVGSVALMAGVAASGRRTNRTRYRPDQWRAAETIVAASGIAALGGLVVTALVEPAALRPGVFPLEAPALAPFAVAGVLIALVPAVVAPRGDTA